METCKTGADHLRSLRDGSRSAARRRRRRPKPQLAHSALSSSRSKNRGGSTSRSTAQIRSLPDGWLVKGGGSAHTRQKIVATAARRFIVIASSDKVGATTAPRLRETLTSSA